MTIKEAAAKYNVSPQAIYQRLKKRKILVESVTDKTTGELTPEGEMIINDLFDTEKQSFKANSRAYAEEQEAKIKQLNIEVAELKEKLKAAEVRENIYKEQVDTLKDALNKEQELHLRALTFLPAPQTETKTETASTGGGSERLTWKERLTGRRRS